MVSRKEGLVGTSLVGLAEEDLWFQLPSGMTPGKFFKATISLCKIEEGRFPRGNLCKLGLEAPEGLRKMEEGNGHGGGSLDGQR